MIVQFRTNPLRRFVGILLYIWQVFTCMLGVIERTARTTENPFENYYGDVPMTGLCRTIEIDLREMLGETDTVPPPLPRENVRGGIQVIR